MKPNVFVKPDEQNKARFNSAMARKGAMKWNSHSVFATPKHLAFRLLKKFTEHTEYTESRNKQPRAGSPTASLAQGDTLRTQQNILQSSCKDKSKIRATKTSVCNLKRLHLPYIFHHPADGDKNGKSYK
ncbi:hypothetical protein CIK89_07765 [Prevotella sp. P4-119]|nr:hypothetical protein CIK89_07765 [Prevotella sp. P4-119]